MAEGAADDVGLGVQVRAEVGESVWEKLTAHPAPAGAIFRQPTPDDAAQIAEQQLDGNPGGLIAVDGVVAATGGVLFHYLPPYGDIYMNVAQRFRGQGIATYLVQELKRTCYERGVLPAARCNTDNVASRKTLQKAGFIPCGHLVSGLLAR